MSARVRMLSGVTIRRVVATERHSACLTCAQVYPLRTDLHTLFAYVPLRMFDGSNRSEVIANFLSHHRSFPGQDPSIRSALGVRRIRQSILHPQLTPPALRCRPEHRQLRRLRADLFQANEALL